MGDTLISVVAFFGAHVAALFWFIILRFVVPRPAIALMWCALKSCFASPIITFFMPMGFTFGCPVAEVRS